MTNHHAIPAAALGLPVSFDRAAQSHAGDPVVALYRRHAALEAVSLPLEARADALRAQLVAEHGAIKPAAASEWWTYDFDHSELRRLNNACDELGDQQGDIVDAMLETPATSREGVLAKLRIALHLHPADVSGADFYEIVTVSFLRDAIRVLEMEALS